MANIGAGAMGQPWLKGGAQWLKPSNVFGLGTGGWGNIGKSFTNLGFGADAATGGSGGTGWRKNIKIPDVETMYDKPASMMSGIWKGLKNPMVNIPLTAAAAGLYTA